MSTDPKVAELGESNADNGKLYLITTSIKITNLLVRHVAPSQRQCPAAQSQAVFVQPPPAAAVSPAPGEVDKVPSPSVSVAPLSAAAEPASPGHHETRK